jgi:CubicO group peptidase (beta-lactamase class C family)
MRRQKWTVAARMILAALAFSVGTSPALAAPEGSIEDFVASELPASGAPGLAYAVVTGGEVADVRGHDVVERGTDTAVTADTPFVIGSISKSFTALAVMQLVEAGRVDLDTGIAEYLDEFAGQPAGDATIRQLLSHTSGYSTMHGNSTDPDVEGGADELARRVEGLAATAPAHAAGERWDYSNANYLILGRLVEVVSGKSFQDYVTTDILEPVGMTHSFVSDGEPHEGVAVGHTPWFGTKRPVEESPLGPGMAPAGGIVASAGDMALYLQMMMNGEDDVVTADSKALMMRPAGAVSPAYGLGWNVDVAGGTVWHDGTVPGVETLASMVPDEQSAAVVLVNAGSGMGLGETVELRNGIVARALGLDYAGEGSAWSRQLLFFFVVLSPVFYLLCMAWAWRHREQIRAKAGFSGVFSLWFPVLTTAVAAWVMLVLVPQLFGAPLGTIWLFSPDFALGLVACAVGGLLWAVFRLGVAYSGRA